MSQKVEVPGDGIVLWREGGGGAVVGDCAYGGAFGGNQQIKRFLQVEEITEVGAGSLGESSLEVFEFAMAVGLVYIRAQAFYNCRRLGLKPGKTEHAFLPPGVKQVGLQAFYDAFGGKHNGELVLVGRSMKLELYKGRGPFDGTGLTVRVLDDDVYAAKYAEYYREEHEAEVGWRRTRSRHSPFHLHPSPRAHLPAPLHLSRANAPRSSSD